MEERERRKRRRVEKMEGDEKRSEDRGGVAKIERGGGKVGGRGNGRNYWPETVFA